jgi:hypothetical protein
MRLTLRLFLFQFFRTKESSPAKPMFHAILVGYTPRTFHSEDSGSGVIYSPGIDNMLKSANNFLNATNYSAFCHDFLPAANGISGSTISFPPKAQGPKPNFMVGHLFSYYA